jgi:Family of unknown function (DUF5906)
MEAENTNEDSGPQGIWAEAEQFIIANDIHYVLKLGKYLVWRDNEWIATAPANFKRFYPGWSKEFAEAVTINMESMGRIHKDLTYSYRDLAVGDYFNMVSRKNWLQPKEGERHWLFDVLMYTLGGGKEENIEHLQRVIAYKFMHPEEFRLPCLLIHGEGGIGKNLLVDRILYLIFDGQTVSLLADNALGTFNSLVKGKAVALIDESAADNTSRSKVKSIVHNQRLTLNEKFIPEIKIDNTALWVIGTNESEGGIFLERSEADRRFSVIHAEKGRTLIQNIADAHDWTIVEAREWMVTEGNRICGDTHEVAKWLGYLTRRYGNQPLPLALHGGDFRRLLDIQKPMDEGIAEAVFLDPDFRYIERKILYAGYKQLTLRSGKKPVGENKFVAMIEGWLKAHRPEIGAKEVWFDKPRKGRRRVWLDSGKPDTEELAKRDNADVYINACREWVGPEPG